MFSRWSDRGKSIIVNGKDAALSHAAKPLINQYIKEYGHMLKFHLDSTQKTLEMSVLLDGEKEPIDIRIDRYVLREEQGRYFISLEGIHTSRAWIDTVAAEMLNGKTFEVPSRYAKLIQMMV